MLEHVVRFVVALLVPALKVSAVKWVRCDFVPIVARPQRFHLADELFYPLAFVHEVLNLVAPVKVSNGR